MKCLADRFQLKFRERKNKKKKANAHCFHKNNPTSLINLFSAISLYLWFNSKPM